MSDSSDLSSAVAPCAVEALCKVFLMYRGAGCPSKV